MDSTKIGQRSVLDVYLEGFRRFGQGGVGAVRTEQVDREQGEQVVAHRLLQPVVGAVQALAVQVLLVLLDDGLPVRRQQHHRRLFLPSKGAAAAASDWLVSVG